MSECVMLAGIPCSGKSTYVEKLKKIPYWENAVVLSTDAYIEKQVQRLGRTYNEIFDDVIDNARWMFGGINWNQQESIL